MIRLRPRWRKVLHDIWENKVRSLLVIASIAIGLFALGMIGTAYEMISQDMAASYALAQPANILVYTSDFDENLVKSIQRLPGVAEAAGGRTLTVRVKTAPDNWKNFDIHMINFADQRINRLKPLEGQTVPGEYEVLVDKNKLADLNAQIGDTIEVELPDGTLRLLRLAGMVHDVSIGSTTGDFFTAAPQGYVTSDTMEWLGQPGSYSQLYIAVAGDNKSLAHVKEVMTQVINHLETGGRLVFGNSSRISDHPAYNYVQAMIGVMGVLGLMVVFLSGFLISNTLSALVNQHIKQIGIMKAIGARNTQIVGMYMVFILIFSVIALVIAVPAGSYAAYVLVEVISKKINFEVQGFRLIPVIVMLQTFIALIVPQAAGAVPAIRGAGITVQQAINSLGIERARRSLMDRALESLRGLSRPLLISLRNTFRRKVRLILTLITLTLGGAIFISTFNVQATVDDYVKQVRKYFHADVTLIFDREYRVEGVRQIAGSVPGVREVESWATPRGELVINNTPTEEMVQIFAPPASSKLVDPVIVKGRWLLPGDQNAITVNDVFLTQYPGMKVGDSLRLKINERDIDFTIVGVFQFVGGDQLIAYTNYEFLSRQLGDLGKSSSYRIISSGEKQTLDSQTLLSEQIDQRFRTEGYHVNEVSTGLSLMRSTSGGMNILIAVLLVLAVLTALVGSIGLMGMMSMNVMERTREIGVMRAIGASDHKIMTLVIVEGLIIGMISWFVGSLLAFPISWQLSNIVSQAIFKAPAHFTLTPNGFFIWLAAVLVLSVLASVLPARNAARLTIREVLAYE
jgi:putative ABC transport system permease protein